MQKINFGRKKPHQSHSLFQITLYGGDEALVNIGRGSKDPGKDLKSCCLSATKIIASCRNEKQWRGPCVYDGWMVTCPNLITFALRGFVFSCEASHLNLNNKVCPEPGSNLQIATRSKKLMGNFSYGASVPNFRDTYSILSLSSLSKFKPRSYSA